MMRKPIAPSQFKTAFNKDSRERCTSVGQEIGGDDPTTLVESVESICDADE